MQVPLYACPYSGLVFGRYFNDAGMSGRLCRAVRRSLPAGPERIIEANLEIATEYYYRRATSQGMGIRKCGESNSLEKGHRSKLQWPRFTGRVTLSFSLCLMPRFPSSSAAGKEKESERKGATLIIPNDDRIVNDG